MSAVPLYRWVVCSWRPTGHIADRPYPFEPEPELARWYLVLSAGQRTASKWAEGAEEATLMEDHEAASWAIREAPAWVEEWPLAVGRPVRKVGP